MGWLTLRHRHLGSLDEGLELVDDVLLGRRCVLKRADAERRSALEREHERLTELRHPAYRGLLGAARDPELVLVLEHVEGDTPQTWLAEHPHDKRAIAIELLRALLHLHEQGWVHGDLKPENLLVDRHGRLRIIDLGLAVPVGARAAGGTPGFVAPEYGRGARASVAGDLYAFGETLRRLGGRPDDVLDALAHAARASDPRARPASCAAALAQLGELALPEDRVGALPLALGPALLDDIDARLRASDGATLALHAPPGAGHSRVLQELGRRAARRLSWVADASLAQRAIERLVAMLDPEGGGALADRAMRAAVRAAQRGVPLLFDDARACDAEGREALVAMARGLAALGRGALILGATDASLRAQLEAEGALAIELPTLDADGVGALLTAASARAGPTLSGALREATDGRAGRVAAAAAWLARHPELGDEAICEWARLRDTPPRTEARFEPAAALEEARRAIASGASRRAERLLASTFPDLSAAPERAPEAASLLASALAASGELVRAEAILAALGEVDRALHARVLERLGRYEDALALADPTRPALAITGASAALALGRHGEAEALLTHGLEHASREETRAELLLLRSDVALRAGRSREAIAAADAAQRAAGGSPRLLAAAESRLGSAHSLTGEPQRARTHHARALEAAEAAGDVAALPPYLVNLATAEHAGGMLGAAIGRYEEAARLAARLGREAMRAAALTNLAGLLVSIGAGDEAASVLRDASDAAERSGSAIYAAQAVLIDAERLARRDPADAIARARLARERFEQAGAARQALEARLLEAELVGGEAARAFCAEHEAALDEAGLGARAALLEAATAGDPREASRAVERAIEACTEQGDYERLPRALGLSARIHQELGTGEGELRRARAVAAIEAVAVTLPPGLRERFRADPERARLLRARSQPASRELGARLGDEARRLLALLRRVLLEPDERRVLDAAIDEALALTRAERAFLLRRRPHGEEDVLIARNLDRDAIHQGRFSRSVAERVMESGEPLLTEMATHDPALGGARSIVDLGLRSIVCVPVRAPSAIVGALYLDHRFESARFGPDDLELVQALGDMIGLALESARLHREAQERARARAGERADPAGEPPHGRAARAARAAARLGRR